MRRVGILWGAALPLILILACASCEDTPLTVPAEGEVVVTATPASVELDGKIGPETAEIDILAQAFDDGGLPLADVTVFFSSDGGELESAGEPVETDSNGVARDTLDVGLDDVGTVTVTARSGTITGTADVDVGEQGVNRLPTASITATPLGQQRKNALVTFRGTGTDADGDPITCYEWTIDSSVNASDENPAPLSASATLTRTYTMEQDLAVSLRVSDGASCADPSFGPDTTINYSIVCDTTAPNADAGLDRTVTLTSGGTATLNGSGSTDAESGIPGTGYVWDCRNGQVLTGQQVDCVYTSTGNFDVRLTVTNGCGQTDTDDVRVTVNP